MKWIPMLEAHDMTPVDPAGKHRLAPLTRSGVILGLVCLGIILVYAWIAHSGQGRDDAIQPRGAYYNLLVQGFRAGQLNLPAPVPAGLSQLPDPYDPVANEPYRATLHDTSYYRGKIYLYFGVTPALVLFWPYAALTGQYLSQGSAAVIFCTAGFLASAWLLLAIRRWHFPDASLAVVAIGVIGLGLSTAVPVMLGRPAVWEVPIACGYAFAMLALAAIWRALHEDARRAGWLLAASLAYGLAVGARPSLLFGGIILLVPVAYAWRSGRAGGPELFKLSACALGPIAGIGLGLMLYNYARFDLPWEFGQRYQLAGVAVAKQKLFNVDYLWFNLRVYFLQPLRWSADFPFAAGIKIPPLPPGYLGVDGAFGALVAMPFLWLAGGVALLGRESDADSGRSPLRWFVSAGLLLFTGCAGPLCLFAGACHRYQVEFLPALALLAAIGLLVWDRAAKSRPTVALAAGALVVFSAATNWLASYQSGPQAWVVAGNNLTRAGQFPTAMREFERALQIEPDFPYAHHGLAIALMAADRLPAAIPHFRQAVASKPNFAEAHNALGVALLRQRQPAEAEREFAAALRASPQFAEAHFDRAVALLQLQRGGEAVAHLEETLRLKPDFPGARERLEFARTQARAAPAK